MTTVFLGEVEILVLRHGMEIERITRPLRQTPSGDAVKYKRRIWLVRNSSIDISGPPLGDEAGASADTHTSAAVTPAAPATVGPAAGGTPAGVQPPEQDVSSVDDGQSIVIGAGSEARLLVDAGPGTGKTHTACLKVAALIRRDDIPGSRIWMISFTRTAVHEIRSRLAALLDSASDAASVRIATLDSLAWTIHSGFSRDAVLTGSYDHNIEATLGKIRSNDDVREELERIRHVVVDEAQDIVGIRAELVLAIIDAVAPDCGVTVFADQAQAIYGFTEDEDAGENGGIRLGAELEDRDFRSVGLTGIHRTDSPALLKIFRDVRRKVLATDEPALVRSAAIRTEIETLADARLGPPRLLEFASLPASALVLMRQRSEVLTASSFNHATPHRLRLSGLPVRMLPWPALLFWDHVERRLTSNTFAARWQQRMAGSHGAPSPEAAWQLLYETAGQSASVIDLHRLRFVLGRSNPPAAFTSPDYGDAGPVIGTIHASKGREADEVYLYLPPPPGQDDERTDAEEEVRVMFVGATRARRRLSVGRSGARRSGNADGRFWKKLQHGRIQVEIGRAYDIGAGGLVGRSVFGDARTALNAQIRLRESPVMTELSAYQAQELGWDFALETAEKVQLGALSDKVKADLREIANRCEAWPPPNYLKHIRSTGLRSMVVRADDGVIDQLHEPWRSSGFLLAPMLLGVCVTKLRQ